MIVNGFNKINEANQSLINSRLLDSFSHTLHITWYIIKILTILGGFFHTVCVIFLIKWLFA